MNRSKILLLALMFGAPLPTAYAGEAAADYPNRPLRLVVPFPPGGGTDMVARAVGQKLTDAWGQQVVVDNRAGGGGVIGTETVARATPDGYTLLLATSSGLVINPLLHPKLSYDPVKDFTPVSLLATNPTILVVHPSLPVKTVKELIAAAKEKPGKLNYASVGQGSPVHLAMELFKFMTGTDIVHIPYKGSSPAVTDLLGEQVQMMFNSIPPVLSHVRAGKLRAIAVGSARRSVAAPDIPTVAESGVPGFETVTWFGIVAPARTPKDIVNKLNAEIVHAITAPDLAKRLISQGSEPRGTMPEGLAKYMREESDRWRKVIRNASIKPE